MAVEPPGHLWRRKRQGLSPPPLPDHDSTSLTRLVIPHRRCGSQAGDDRLALMSYPASGAVGATHEPAGTG
jgi:hypothetical protein